jgi:hypothetical protein
MVYELNCRIIDIPVRARVSLPLVRAGLSENLNVAARFGA